jgi:death-on-curing protein
LRSIELLESAIAAPQATKMEEPLIKDMMEGAAAYLFYLCSNRPFVDGNKRVALATCLVFLRQNGIYDPVNLDDDLWKSLTLDVAGGRIDRTTTTARLRELAGTSVAA